MGTTATATTMEKVPGKESLWRLLVPASSSELLAGLLE
jgi:hypothetical protein